MSSCHGSAFGRGRVRGSLCLPAKNTEPAAWEDLLHPETSLSVAEEPGLGSPCLLALPSGLSFPTCTMGSHKSEMMLTGLTLTVISLPSSCTFHSSLGLAPVLVGAFSLVWCFTLSAVIYCCLWMDVWVCVS